MEKEKKETKCFIMKEDFLFLVQSLNEAYVELKNQMSEIEDRYERIKCEAKERGYYEYKPCCLTLAVSKKQTELPF